MNNKSSEINISDILKDIPLFSYLEDEEIRSLEKIAIQKTYQKNTILLTEGDTGDSLYVVCKGKANAVGTDVSGRQIVLNTFSRGDYFGEMSFIDGKPRSATVETKKITQVLIIPRDKFRNMIASNPDICFHLMKGLAEKVRKATQQIEDLVFTDVYGRTTRVLLRLAKSDGENMVIDERLTHQDIADMVGSSREMVSRILKSLSDGDYISIKNKKITIMRDLPYRW